MRTSEYYKAVGTFIRDAMKSSGLNAEHLARKLTLQCVKNLPLAGRDGFRFSDDKDLVRAHATFISEEERPITDAEANSYIHNEYGKGHGTIMLSIGERTLPHYVSANIINNYVNG